MLKSVQASLLALTFALLVVVANSGTANVQAATGKYDTDGDGLVEVSNLEQLDAMRYDLDLDGLPDSDTVALAYEAAFPVTGAEVVCDTDCTGYELTRSLDFNDVDSYASGAVNPGWTTGDGWLPIEEFNVTFEGNGNTISNLYIDQTGSNPNDVGLFGTTLMSSIIRSIGLVDVDVTSTVSIGSGSVSGDFSVGGLVGSNRGNITDSYSTGGVTGTVTSNSQSYVSGGVGGLVGSSTGGNITRSHATGSVVGTGGGRSRRLGRGYYRRRHQQQPRHRQR